MALAWRGLATGWPSGAASRLGGLALPASATALLTAAASGLPAHGLDIAGVLVAVTVATLAFGPAAGLLVLAAGLSVEALVVGRGAIDLTVLGGAGVVELAAVAFALRRLLRARAEVSGAERMLEDVRTTEARFRGLLEGAPDAIVISNRDGRISLLNAEAERLFGYDRAEMLGQPIDMLMPERFRGRHAGHVAAYLAQPTTRRMGDGSNMFGRRKDGSEFPIETNLSLLSDHGEALVTSVIRDLTPRREVQEREALLMRELNHRVKNTLASVQSIVAQTLRSAVHPKAFSQAVLARIAALSQSHDLLTRNDWTGARLVEIVSEQLRPYARDGAPFEVSGPDLTLRPNRAVTLGMAVGELATNAAKFGALSAGGAVTVEWSVREGPAGRVLRLTWREVGGPSVSPPEHEGFGTRLIKRSLAAGLHGSAELDYGLAGLTATLEFPLVEGE
ncbi:HWE histidine kinase domain-containing protein [Phenylobacterium sp.]|uniref:sensor histidine kinase n=1 Tax=Phenylobacterium sp. TaxID=1871053 RepID=UPI0025E5A825|nr:HWE histidine kinase domain-containing protein [Phenylobacterium sp.]